MTSSHKPSFVLQFILYFSLALIVLGVGQSILGTLRWYNASEQSYEKLSPGKTYTLNDEITPTSLEKNTPEEVSEKVSYYAANSKDSAQDILKDVSWEKIPAIETVSQKNDNISFKASKNKKTSPVEVSVSPEEESAAKGYQETILTVVTGKYFRDALWKFPIIIDTERAEPRWQMYNESITLSNNIVSLSEVSKVLVHEIGHMIDIYSLRKTLKKSDISEEFYQISWKDPSTIKAWVPQSSFVSGYASSNQYEDFAESFAMYIFHNKEFLKRAGQNDFLKQKYNFLKRKIFWDVFLWSAYEKDPVPKKVWDVTKIAIRWNNVETIFAWINTLKPYKS